MKKKTKIILGISLSIVLILGILMYFHILDFGSVQQTAFGSSGSSSSSSISATSGSGG